ncbi:MAG: hypothetical protein VKI81_01210 [Synechococcaceae cyanobacterium]|nr:hypothetical protein [Synechococcaceae cyanobacterium]
MAVVNRCAIGLHARPPLLEWARALCTQEQMATAAQECSIYLIPTYGSDEEAMRLLEDSYETIFEAELKLFCRDEDAWPSPLTLALFQEWFEIRFYPLVQDLCAEKLELMDIDEEFVEEVRAVLQQNPEMAGD